VIKTYSLTVNLNGLLKAFIWPQYPMSEMNGVSELLATWVKFILSRKPIYTSNGNRNGLLKKAVWEGLTFFEVHICLSSKWVFYMHWVKAP
jgi:hypothetical protein